MRLQRRTPRFDPWVGRISWRRAWQLTPVFLPGESRFSEGPGGLQSMGFKELDPTEWLSMQHTRQVSWPSSPGGANGKESTWWHKKCGLGPHLRMSFWWGRFPGVRNDNLLQYSCLENSMNRGTWWATVNGVTTSQTWWSTTRTTTKVLIHYCYLLLIFIFCISPTAQHNAGME